MFKGKIRTLCGNEFTAFYLKAVSLKEDSASAEGHSEEYTNDLLKLGGAGRASINGKRIISSNTVTPTTH